MVSCVPARLCLGLVGLRLICSRRLNTAASGESTDKADSPADINCSDAEGSMRDLREGGARGEGAFVDSEGSSIMAAT